MQTVIIIDGNNLLFAMHAHAPIPTVGRTTMAQLLDRFAREIAADIELVFDGGAPSPGLVSQMASKRVHVVFSAPRTADDVIVDMLAKRSKANLRVVSSDSAIRKEASRRGIISTDARTFIDEIFGGGSRKKSSGTKSPPGRSDSEIPTEQEKDAPIQGSTDDWLKWLELENQ